MAKRYKLHPIVNSFAQITGDAYQELLADAREHGIRIPAIVWKGQLIDGRNRQNVAEELGIELPVTEFEGTEFEACMTAVAANAMRRHETQDQKAISANLCSEIIEPLKVAAEKRRLANLRRGDNTPEVTFVSHRDGQDSNEPADDSSNDAPGRVRTQLAKLYGVSEGQISKGKRLLERDRDAAMKVLAGELKITQADQEDKAKKAGDTRRQQNRRIRVAPPAELKAMTYRLVIVGTEWVRELGADWLASMGTDNPLASVLDEDCLLLFRTGGDAEIGFRCGNLIDHWSCRRARRYIGIVGTEKFNGEPWETIVAGYRGKVPVEDILPRATIKCGKDGIEPTLLQLPHEWLKQTHSDKRVLHFAGKLVVAGSVNWPLNGEPVAA